jgi:hypothetical protein
MVIYGLLLLLLASFTFHIIIIVLYIKSRNSIYFYWFIATVAINLSVALPLSILALSKPYLIRELKLKYFFWLLSGFLAVLMLIIKMIIFRNIYKRTKDPNWFHVNYFGKKVYEKGIVKQVEFLGIFFTLPFFLLFGAYFISRLVNFVMHGTGL